MNISTIQEANDLRETLQYIADVLNDETLSNEVKLTRIASQVEVLDKI